MSAPLVSVITPAYKAVGYLPATLASVQAQTMPDWEMIVVDDCSPDGTGGLLARVAREDGRIRAECATVNRGPGPTRNRALALARGRYLAFLDADDLWDPVKLERQIAFMEKERIAFSFSAYRVISARGEPLGVVDDIPALLGYADLLKNTIVGCLTVVLDREQVGEIAFPPLRSSQDLALWLAILKRGFVAHGLPEVLASYRIVGASNTRNKLGAARDVWALYRDVERLPLARRGWYFANYAVRGLRKHLSSGASAGSRA
ncbi:MAG TPA: glycosyltransferase family 2 protein [Myxococcales bacterium]|nr:glycosyltransferase family 2 protein [Myxococcales bacterium]